MLERDIIIGCVNGKKKAQETLYLEYSGLLYSICLRYSRNKSEAQDVFHDGFLKILLYIKDFRFQGSFEGWIKRIMVNTALLHNRDNLKRCFHEDIEQANILKDEDESSNLLSIDNNEIDSKTLLNIVQQLPDGYRTVFNLYAIEGFSHKEIAEKLSISENTSKSQLSRARLCLKSKISEFLYQQEKVYYYAK